MKIIINRIVLAQIFPKSLIWDNDHEDVFREFGETLLLLIGNPASEVRIRSVHHW